MDEANRADLVELTAEIISAYVSNNPLLHRIFQPSSGMSTRRSAKLRNASARRSGKNCAQR
jgi:predicted transcriptional regulator